MSHPACSSVRPDAEFKVHFGMCILAMEGPLYRHGPGRPAGRGNGHMRIRYRGAMRGVVAAPAPAGNVDLRPGMQVAVFAAGFRVDLVAASSCLQDSKNCANQEALRVPVPVLRHVNN